MKKVLLLICTMLCLCIIPCNNVYCEDENILDTWNPIKKMHTAKNYDEIIDLQEDHIYEMNTESIISNNKGLHINVYINGDKMFSTSGQVNIIAQQNNPDLSSGYYYVARGYEQEDESLYLLQVYKYSNTTGRDNFIFNDGEKSLVFRLNDTEEIYLGIDSPGVYDVFYYPFLLLDFYTGSHDDGIDKGILQQEEDCTINMNGILFHVNPYNALSGEELPFNDYFDFTYDLKTNTIVMNIKQSFTVELGEKGYWICGYTQFSHSNLKIIGNGEVTINHTSDLGDYNSIAIETNYNVTIGDENSNLSFIYNDLIDDEYKRQKYLEEGYQISTAFLSSKRLEMNNTSLYSYSTDTCITSGEYYSSEEAFVANNCNIEIIIDDIYAKLGDFYPMGMLFTGDNAIFNNSSLKIKDACTALCCFSESEGITFNNTSIDIDSHSTCFSITNPIKFIYDDPYINIFINQKDGGKMFYWDPEVATIDNPIDMSNSNKYMKYEMVKDEDGSNKILFYGPSFIFNNIENINEEDINYYFSTENGILSITNPTKPGYDFAGWYLDEDLTAKWQNNSIIDEPYNFVLYAKWNKKENKPSYVVPSTGIK